MVISLCWMWMGWGQVGKVHSRIAFPPSFWVHSLDRQVEWVWVASWGTLGRMGRARSLPYDRGAVVCVRTLMPSRSFSARLKVGFCPDSPKPFSRLLPKKQGKSWQKGEGGRNRGFAMRNLTQRRLKPVGSENCNSGSLGHCAHPLGNFQALLRSTWDCQGVAQGTELIPNLGDLTDHLLFLWIPVFDVKLSFHKESVWRSLKVPALLCGFGELTSVSWLDSMTRFLGVWRIWLYSFPWISKQ